MGYKGLIRRKLLEDIYNKMSDDDKRLYVYMTMQDKSHDEILQAIERQRMQLEDIKSGQNWTRSFGSDLLANFTSAGVLWLGSKLFK